MGDNFDPLHPLDPKKNDLLDPSLSLNREDYRGLTDLEKLKKEGDDGDALEPPIPDLAEILAAPRPPKIADTQLVSVAVTDDVPLKDVFIELSRLANIDIEVDAGISGGVSFRAKDRPFNEVVERLADLANLRYSMKNNVLRVERDAPYIEIYTLDFLNIERTATNSIAINTSVLSAGGGSSSDSGGGSSGGGSSGGSGGSSALNSGSSSSIKMTSENDFWAQFEESIKKILSYQPPTRVSATTVAVQPSVPQLPPGVPVGGDGLSSGDAGEAAPAPAPPPAVMATETTIAASEQPFYILSKQASTLTVSANSRQHDLIQEFIRRIRANAFSQVIIEVKIVEVTLNDEFQSGINWSQLGGSKIGITANFDQTTVPSTGAPQLATFNFNPKRDLFGPFHVDLDMAVKLVEAFGTTRTLSSPRLHAINNQEAVLTFAKNQVYYDLDVQQTEATGTGAATATTVTVNSTAHTIPIGIILAMQPSINTETSEVTLNIRPTLSRVSGFVSDPAVAFILAQLAAAGAPTDGLSSQVPIVEVRELDSILKLKSGQVMVIGGLMQDVGAHADQGVPGISNIPWFGNLFKASNKQSSLSELVIFIRATIVDSGGNADEADRRVYEKFTKDPRPLKF